MAPPQHSPPAVSLIAPTEEAWRAMSLPERESFLVRILDALSDPAVAMTEGRRHKKAKTRTLDALGLHFGAIGRDVYLAEEMAVLYPGEAAFSPDVLAVVGVREPDDDPRMAWVVVDEGRGLDLVIEVLHRGSRSKDLVDNVERYARLGIPEYFVYDRLHQRIHGYRLPDASARRYQRIVPQLGRHTSTVLGLDLAIERSTLRFFYGMAELPGTSDLIGRLNGMLADLEARAADAEAQIHESAAKAEQAQVEATRAQVEAIRAQAEATRAQAEATRSQAEATRALGALREGITGLLAARGIVDSEAIRAQLAACSEAATLQRWLVRAVSASTAEAVFAD